MKLSYLSGVVFFKTGSGGISLQWKVIHSEIFNELNV